MNKIINGDCIYELSQMGDSFVDLTVTSPPYDNMRNYNIESEWNDLKWRLALLGIYNATKDGGVLVWIVGDATIKGSETGTSFKQALYAKEIGFRLHDTMIWNKTSVPPTQHNRYQQSFEYMFIFSKGKPKTFNPITEPSKTAGRIRKSHRSDNDNHGLNGEGFYKTKTRKIITNCWAKNVCSERIKHPAKFPINLVEDHIKTWSNKGDLVLDPFMGSGTTALASKKLDRLFLGIELNKDYYKTSIERINNEKNQQELF